MRQVILVALLLSIGLCFPTITIYANVTAPAPNLTLVSGGTLDANTTYNFQCVYIRGYRGYYGTGCFSNPGQEVNITTNSTHKSINMQWGTYPFPMTNIICRWRNDNQSFKWADGTYKMFGDASNSTGYWQNWTETNYYGGLTIWSGTNKTINATNLKSGSVYATSLGIPFFSMRDYDWNNLSVMFPAGGSACVYVNGSPHSSADLYNAIKQYNATQWIKASKSSGQPYSSFIIYGNFIGNGSISFQRSSITLHNHALGTTAVTPNENVSINLNLSSFMSTYDSSILLYGDPQISANDSFIGLNMGALVIPYLTLRNTMLTAISTPSKYITGISNTVFTDAGLFNDRYPVAAQYRNENNTMVKTRYMFTPENAAASANKSFNITNLKHYNSGTGFQAVNGTTQYDLHLDMSATGANLNNSWNKIDCYNCWSDRTSDNIPVVVGSSDISANSPNYYINVSYLSTTLFRLIQPNGSGASGYSINMSNSRGEFANGTTDINGMLNLTIREHVKQYNNSTAGGKMMNFSLFPVQTTISLGGAAINTFNHSIFGAKDWAINVAPICTASDYGAIWINPNSAGIRTFN